MIISESCCCRCGYSFPTSQLKSNPVFFLFHCYRKIFNARSIASHSVDLIKISSTRESSKPLNTRNRGVTREKPILSSCRKAKFYHRGCTRFVWRGILLPPAKFDAEAFSGSFVGSNEIRKPFQLEFADELMFLLKFHCSVG